MTAHSEKLNVLELIAPKPDLQCLICGAIGKFTTEFPPVGKATIRAICYHPFTNSVICCMTHACETEAEAQLRFEELTNPDGDQ